MEIKLGFGTIILGIFILLAAVVLAKPEYAGVAWSLGIGLLSLIGSICIIGIIAVVIIVVVVLILIFWS